MYLELGHLPRHKLARFSNEQKTGMSKACGSRLKTTKELEQERFLDYLARNTAAKQSALYQDSLNQEPEAPHDSSSKIVESKSKLDQSTTGGRLLSSALEEIFNPGQNQTTSKSKFDFTPPPLTSRPAQSLKNSQISRLSEDLLNCAPPQSSFRYEDLADGGKLIKDPLGKVLYVRSKRGIALSYTYDPEGRLVYWMRTDGAGNVHTVGECNYGNPIENKDRVVTVRDGSGVIRAQGHSANVAPDGTLTVRRLDGQYWSIDIIREIHVERRLIDRSDLKWNFVTALLADDGFRLSSKFQVHNESDMTKFRFYGRDGSVVQFNSEEALRTKNADNSFPAGSRDIDQNYQYRDGLKARTAWDAVYEYFPLYVSNVHAPHSKI